MDVPLPPGDAGEPPAGLGRRSIVIVTVILVALIGLFALWVGAWFVADDAVDLEEDVRAILDSQFERSALPTWCEGGCSSSDDEWHAPGAAEDVARSLVAVFEDAGYEARYQAGAPDAFLVLVSGSSDLDLGVTGPGWARATPAAAGTAVWFTSVTVFDDPALSS